MFTINNELRKVYEQNWKDLIISLNDVKSDVNQKHIPTNPLCLEVNNCEAYNKSSLKVMFFGQETNDWGKLQDWNTPNELMGAYSKFFNGYKFGWKGQFRNAVNLLIKTFNKEFNDKEPIFIWNNLVKIGKQRVKGIKKSGIGKPPKDITEIEMESFNIIPDEIKILKPDVIIFFTGPSYDKELKNKFSSISIEEVDGFKKNAFAQIKGIENAPLVFRIYHPGYLYRTGITKFYDKITSIIKETTVGNTLA